MENKKIYSAIPKIMSEITAISKDRKNQQQGFSYRSIDDVMNELHSVIAKNGVFPVPNVLKEERSERVSEKAGFNNAPAKKSVIFYTRLTVEYKFYADDGSFISAVVIGEAMDSGDKASNKALSIAFKYACLQIFCIPTEEDKDPDAITHSGILPMQQQVQQEKTKVKNAPASAPAPKKKNFTDEEALEIKNILGSTYPNGEAVFSEKDVTTYRQMLVAQGGKNTLASVKILLNDRLNNWTPPASSLAEETPVF